MISTRVIPSQVLFSSMRRSGYTKGLLMNQLIHWVGRVSHNGSEGMLVPFPIKDIITISHNCTISLVVVFSQVHQT